MINNILEDAHSDYRSITLLEISCANFSNILVRVKLTI
jgi:hypothetical protein